MPVSSILRAIDEYDGTKERFGVIMKDAFDLSRRLRSVTRSKTDFTRYVADAIGVSPAIIDVWINSGMSPASPADRQMVLDHVRSWFRAA